MRYKNITTFSYLRYISLRQKDYSGMRSGRGIDSRGIIVGIMNVNWGGRYSILFVQGSLRYNVTGEILSQHDNYDAVVFLNSGFFFLKTDDDFSQKDNFYRCFFVMSFIIILLYVSFISGIENLKRRGRES